MDGTKLWVHSVTCIMVDNAHWHENVGGKIAVLYVRENYTAWIVSKAWPWQGERAGNGQGLNLHLNKHANFSYIYWGGDTVIWYDCVKENSTGFNHNVSLTWECRNLNQSDTTKNMRKLWLINNNDETASFHAFFTHRDRLVWPNTWHRT